MTFVSALPGLAAALLVMLAGFTLADVLGQALLAARGLTGGSPVSGVPVADASMPKTMESEGLEAAVERTTTLPIITMREVGRSFF